MSALTAVILIFCALGGVDYLLGNKLGLGEEFEHGFMMLGVMALSMIGMIVIAPLLASRMEPLFDFFADVLHLDPSVVPASLLANDMGGAPLATQVAKDAAMGRFNALVVSSMMGCTISFTIPFALGVVKREQHRPLILGLLCGIVTIPVGCFVGGLWSRLPIGALAWNLLPLTLFSALIAAGLWFFPKASVKVFGVFGQLMKALIVCGLLLGIYTFLTGKELIAGLATLEDGAAICLNAAVVMAGMFPLVALLSRLLARPLRALGRLLGINEIAVVGLFSSLATSATSFGVMGKMDRRGAMLNAAFAVSGAFTLASHLAFTMAYDVSCLGAVIVGKLSAGVTAVVLAALCYRRLDAKTAKDTEEMISETEQTEKE